MFWKREKKVPWWAKWIQVVKHLLVSLAATTAALTSLFAYIQLDITEFQESTEMVVASDGNTLYVQWDVATRIEENATLIYYLEGEQIGHYHYDKVDPHSFIHAIKVPVDVHGERWDFYAEWRFRGVTTGFLPKGLKFVTKVEVPNEITDANSRGVSVHI